MNILPKIRAISAFHEHVQTLKRTGINEDAIAENCTKRIETYIANQEVFNET